jgi:hypothetical protein
MPGKEISLDLDSRNQESKKQRREERGNAVKDVKGDIPSET